MNALIRKWTCVAVVGAACIAGCQSNGRDNTLQDPAPVERQDLVTMRDKPVTLIGRQPMPGEKAPAFTAVANDLSTFTFNPEAGKVWILSAVPSLDTSTCSTQTRRFNEEAAKLGEDVTVLTISMDLPFAQKRWCGTENIENVQTLSDARDQSFAKNYGLRIKENGLLARAVYVVGRDGTVVYHQVVRELSKEPDYEPLLAAAKSAAVQ